jgi:hypothetical protein
LVTELSLGLGTTVFGVLTLHALNRIAWLWAEAAHFLLGTPPKAQPITPAANG